MNKQVKRIIRSDISIRTSPSIIWEHITNVQIEKFSDPLIFKLLNIPKPTRAEMIVEEQNRKRIAYFSTGKRFFQNVQTWKPHKEYSFSFNPEKGFKAGYFFDLKDGVFQLQSGHYFLRENESQTVLQLQTTYSIDRRWFRLLNTPVRLVLKVFQTYLLQSIKKNAENENDKV